MPVLAELLSFPTSSLDWVTPITQGKGKKRQACPPCLLCSGTQAGLPAGCYLLHPVRVLWWQEYACCILDLELLGKGSWAISASRSNLVLSPCMYVDIFGLGSYCHGYFVNLFTCKRLNWDNAPLPSVFVHNWVLLVQCKL